MTPARKKALKWVDDHGEVQWWPKWDNKPTLAMRRLMMKDGQLQRHHSPDGIFYSLTEKGRSMLSEAES